DGAIAGRITGGYSKTHQVSIGKDILLRGAGDRDAPVRPRSGMLGQYRRAVVIVTHIGWLDARVALQRQRTGYIRSRLVTQPGHTVVGRLVRMHLVTKIGGTGRLTTRRCPRCLVIPRSKEGACFTDRQVRLPLCLGSVSVGVQLEGRTEGHAA